MMIWIDFIYSVGGKETGVNRDHMSTAYNSFMESTQIYCNKVVKYLASDYIITLLAHSDTYHALNNISHYANC